MAKAKPTTTDLDKRLKSVDELIESTDSLIAKFQASSSLNQEAISEFKKQWTSLQKLKETLGQDVPTEVKKRVDQAREKLRNFLKEKLKPSPVSESQKAQTLESLDEALENLNDKLEELKAQAEGGQSKKKGKNHNKGDKPEKWIENLSYHISRLEGIKGQYTNEATVEQDQTLQEIISYFQDYLSNAEYQQDSQKNFIDGLYESFEKPDEPLNHSFLDEEIEFGSPGQRISVREEGKENTITTGSENQNIGDKMLFMNKMRQTGFEHETTQMPKISDNDIKSEYNFFDVFESSAKNMPQETDYYPNASTKERVSTKSIYPKRKIVGEHMFERFDVDTLFFIFYFQKDTYEQSLAAKELKKRAWRFHKKYLTWFKRLEPPRVTNDDYEQGTYAFFDFEPGGWCQRRKSDFTFKYSYLEDDKP